MKKLVGLLGALAAITTGCRANNRRGAQQPPTGDGGTGCVSAQALSLCPATWELAQTEYVCEFGAQVSLGDAGSYLARRDFLGEQSIFCVYDRTSHALVGARRDSRALDFCNGTSSLVYSGVATEEMWQNFLGNLGSGKCPSRGKCRVDLSMSGCHATWEEAQTAPSCPAAIGVALGHAAGYLARGNTSGGYVAFACYYDPVTHALVGAWSASDIPQFCNDTSYDVLYGDIDQGWSIKPDLGLVPCPDGGVDPRPGEPAVDGGDGGDGGDARDGGDADDGGPPQPDSGIKVWTAAATKLVAEDRGGGQTAPHDAADECTYGRTYTLTVADHRLRWRLCIGTATDPAYKLTEGERVLSATEFNSVIQALDMVTTSSKMHCGADKQTLLLKVTNPSGESEYRDDFYACLKMGTYVTHVDQVFAALAPLAK
jgi:hypothetical protein